MQFGDGHPDGCGPFQMEPFGILSGHTLQGKVPSDCSHVNRTMLVGQIFSACLKFG